VPRHSFVAWTVAALLVTVWSCLRFAPEQTVPTLLLTYFVVPQLWLLLTVPLLLISMWRRNPWAMAGSAVAFAFSFGLLGWQLPATVAHTSPTLRLMTYNIARGAGGAAALAATIRAQRPDVLCLQETNTLKAGVLNDLLRSLPGFQARRSREVMILSRFPVLASREDPLPTTSRQLLSAELSVAGTRLTVLNAHFTTIPLRGGWMEAWDSRRQQLAAFLRVTHAAPGALVACGDFNTPARGQVYAELGQNLRNAFDGAGTGFGYTFPSNVPLVRIDHLWLRDVRAVSAFVPDSRASDHRPLVTDLALP